MPIRSVMHAVILILSFSCHPAFAGAMHAAYINKDGWNTGYIDQFNTNAGKSLAIVNIFTSFDYNWPNQLRYQASNIVSRQATPMITWMPVTSPRKTVNLLPEILAGQWNSYIDNWIAGLKSWQATYPAASRPTVLIRFAHEFNGNWYPWGNDPDRLKTAWRYIHSRFDAAGVTGVEWVWCANNVDVDSYRNISLYYPGDDVVDWTGLDGYNWGSNYSFSRWKNFSETFSIPYIKLVTAFPAKPVILAEVASAEPSDTPNISYGQNGNDTDANENKDTWVEDMYSRIMLEYPAIRAVAWFNLNKELSWALNGTARSGLPNTGLTAYQTVMTDSFYHSAFTPLANGPIAEASDVDTLSPVSHTPYDETPLLVWIGDGEAPACLPGERDARARIVPAVYHGDGYTDTADCGQAAIWKTALTIPPSASTLNQNRLPLRGEYNILPAAIGQKLRENEAEGFLRLPARALEAMLQSRLDMIETP